MVIVRLPSVVESTKTPSDHYSRSRRYTHIQFCRYIFRVNDDKNKNQTNQANEWRREWREEIVVVKLRTKYKKTLEANKAVAIN